MAQRCFRAPVWAFAAVMAGLSLGACSQENQTSSAGPAARPSLPAPRAPFSVGDQGLPAFVRCLQGKTTVVSAHRGGPEPGFPENAIETMANTLTHGPMFMEIDVATARDGTLYLMHDRDLERTTTGQGAVNRSDWSQIKDLRLEDNDGAVTAFAPPSLREALEWARGRTVLQLDIKRTTDHGDVVRLLNDMDAKDYTLIIVYSVEDAAKVHRLDPTVTLSVGVDSEADLATLESAGVDLNNIWAWTGTQGVRLDVIRMLRDRGIPAAGGTLWDIDGEIAASGDEARYARIAAQGLQVLATDRHRQAYDALQANGDTIAAIEACAEG